MRVEKITSSDLDKDTSWLGLYSESFPEYEREPIEVVKKGSMYPGGSIFRLQDENRTLGIATTQYLHSQSIVFLVYLAISKKHHGAGMGSMLFQEIWHSEVVNSNNNPTGTNGLIWEIDPLEKEAEDIATRMRRFRFFKKNHGRLLRSEYFQPPINGKEPIRMNLMARLKSETNLSIEQERSFISAIYIDKYHRVNKINLKSLRSLMQQGLNENN